VLGSLLQPNLAEGSAHVEVLRGLSPHLVIQHLAFVLRWGTKSSA